MKPFLKPLRLRSKDGFCEMCSSRKWWITEGIENFSLLSICLRYPIPPFEFWFDEAIENKQSGKDQCLTLLIIANVYHLFRARLSSILPKDYTVYLGWQLQDSIALLL